MCVCVCYLVYAASLCLCVCVCAGESRGSPERRCINSPVEVINIRMMHGDVTWSGGATAAAQAPCIQLLFGIIINLLYSVCR